MEENSDYEIDLFRVIAGGGTDVGGKELSPTWDWRVLGAGDLWKGENAENFEKGVTGFPGGEKKALKEEGIGCGCQRFCGVLIRYNECAFLEGGMVWGVAGKVTHLRGPSGKPFFRGRRVCWGVGSALGN